MVICSQIRLDQIGLWQCKATLCFLSVVALLFFLVWPLERAKLGNLSSAICWASFWCIFRYNCCVGRVSTRDGKGSYDCVDLVIPLLNPWWIQLVLLFVRGLHPEMLHIPLNLFALFPNSHILRSFLLVSKTKFLINSATNDCTVWKIFWDRLHNLQRGSDPVFKHPCLTEGFLH